MLRTQIWISPKGLQSETFLSVWLQQHPHQRASRISESEGLVPRLQLAPNLHLCPSSPSHEGKQSHHIKDTYRHLTGLLEGLFT